MMRPSLLRDDSGAGAAEFALVLPLLLLFIFGIIDGGRFMWAYNQAEKATQAGTRTAIVTQIIPQGLQEFKYVGQTVGGVAYTQGDPLQASALGEARCERTGGTLTCTCAVAFCPSLGAANTAGFNAIVARMQSIYPPITADNVVVEYHGSGVGYAGDPSGMDISPLVTVRLKDLFFQPVTTLLFVQLPMPNFGATLTSEDASGSYSN